jgi:hypothetical protein
MQFPLTSSLFGPSILLNTLFANTLSVFRSITSKNEISKAVPVTGREISRVTRCLVNRLREGSEISVSCTHSCYRL